MLSAGSILDWFTGGADHPYMKLFHCMNHDTLWVSITVGLDLLVGAGYGLIALHWWRNARDLPDVPARRALATMRNIFVFCALCGYMFIPLKMIWPAWRLYDIFMAFLVYFTWRYAWNANNLKVVYSELGRTARLSAELEKSQEEGRRKTAFLNAISHDLRTPLNGLALQAEVARIAAENNDPTTVRDAVRQIGSCAHAAAGLLESLLECARLDWHEEPNRVESFALIHAIQHCIDAVRARADEKRLDLCASGGDRIYIRTDRSKLERVVGNLLSNAVKFTSEGGVRITAETAAGGLELHVTDSGVGILPEQQGRLFEEFYQVGNYERDRNKGFGLGLAIARRLARQLGGDISVASSVGVGTRFTLSLPNVVVDTADLPGRVAAGPVAAVPVGR